MNDFFPSILRINKKAVFKKITGKKNLLPLTLFNCCQQKLSELRNLDEYFDNFNFKNQKYMLLTYIVVIHHIITSIKCIINVTSLNCSLHIYMTSYILYNSLCIYVKPVNSMVLC